MRLSALVFAMGVLLATSSPVPAQEEGEWDIAKPLESEDFHAPADVMTEGNCPTTEETVELKLEKGSDGGGWTNVANPTVQVNNGVWTYTFNDLPKHGYKLTLYQDTTPPVEKAHVKFQVKDPPE